MLKYLVYFITLRYYIELCIAREATGVLVPAAFLGLKLNTPGTSCYI
jgi:hypothetical protein